VKTVKKQTTQPVMFPHLSALKSSLSVFFFQQSHHHCMVHVERVTTVRFSNVWSVYTATVSASLDITQSPLFAVSLHVASGTPSIL